jgi:hypothetical protein
MARVGNLCAIEKIPGCENTRLNVNDNMVEIGTSAAGVVMTPFQQLGSVPFSVLLRSWDNISYFS